MLTELTIHQLHDAYLRVAGRSRRGLRTAGYISGYRGSPLGTIGHELSKIADRLKAAEIVFAPGLNEDLAMTAVWGSQQIEFVPGHRYDGVFSMWRGKGPGVDRSDDAIKHANISGTHPLQTERYLEWVRSFTVRKIRFSPLQAGGRFSISSSTRQP